jgi:hypothetical protein
VHRAAHRLRLAATATLHRPVRAARRKLAGQRLLQHARHALRRNARRLGRSAASQFAAGLFRDGPRETWHAIKKNPRRFVIGMCLTGACAVTGDFLGLPMHPMLVGASGLAAGVEVVQLSRTELRDARGRRQKARVAGKMAWLPALVAGTALGGGAIGGHAESGGAAAAARISSIGARGARAFASGVVTGGDLPMAVVTTVQGWKDRLRQGTRRVKKRTATGTEALSRPGH